MEIIIHDKNAYQHSIEQIKVLWQVFIKRNRRTYLIQYGLGFLFLILGVTPISSSFSKTEFTNNITHQTVTKYDKDTLNIVLAVGIVYIVMVSASLIRMRKAKVSHLDEAGYRGRIVYKILNESITIIGEEYLKYENPVSKTELRWAAFSNFYLYKNHLILNLDRKGLATFVINTNLVPPETLPNLLTIIGQRVSEKKI